MSCLQSSCLLPSWDFKYCYSQFSRETTHLSSRLVARGWIQGGSRPVNECLGLLSSSSTLEISTNPADLTSAGNVCIGQLSFFTALCMSMKDNEIPRNADFRVTSKFYWVCNSQVQNLWILRSTVLRKKVPSDIRKGCNKILCGLTKSALSDTP